LFGQFRAGFESIRTADSVVEFGVGQLKVQGFTKNRCLRVPLSRGEVIPHIGFDTAFAICPGKMLQTDCVTQTGKIELSLRMALPGRSGEPFASLHLVSEDSLPESETQSEAVLSGGIARFRGCPGAFNA
jgi:hypothetical protein